MIPSALTNKATAFDIRRLFLHVEASIDRDGRPDLVVGEEMLWKEYFFCPVGVMSPGLVIVPGPSFMRAESASSS